MGFLKDRTLELSLDVDPALNLIKTKAGHVDGSNGCAYNEGSSTGQTINVDFGTDNISHSYCSALY